MSIVFAQHLGDSKDYVFEVPDRVEVKAGDYLLVETMRGLRWVTAVTGEIWGDAERLALRLGAYLPIRPVVAVIPGEYKEMAAKAMVADRCVERGMPY